MNKWIGRAAAAALVVFGTARADAQITAVISTPKRVEARAAVAAQQAEVAKQDSIARVTLTGMKQWVDSAAGALALRPDTGTAPSETTIPTTPPPTRADSTPSTTRPTTPPQPPSTEFRDGARAPNTATQAPAIAFTGALLVFAGLLMRRRPRAARIRRSR